MHDISKQKSPSEETGAYLVILSKVALTICSRPILNLTKVSETIYSISNKVRLDKMAAWITAN